MRTLVGFFARVFSGLRFRLLVLVILTCAPLVALMLHTSGEDRRRAKSSWIQRSQRLQQVAQKEEHQIIGSTRQLLLAFSESASVHSLNSRRCKKAVDELFAAYPRYANLGILTTNGEVLASALPIVGSENLADRNFFRAVVKTGDFAIGRGATADKNSLMTFGLPAFDTLGQVSAVVFAELDLPHFGRSGTELANQLPKAATWTQIDRHGTILARYPAPEDWNGKQYPEPSLLANVFSASNALIEATSPEGILNVYAFNSMPSRLAGGEVVTILGIPERVLFADADRVLRRNLTWLAFAAGTAMLFGFMGSRWLILGPVQALVRSSTRLAGGDFSVRTGLPHGRDELGQLTLAFDQMAQALEQRELERQRASHKLQVLSHRLVEVQESERRHIARELHDEIGQSLTAAEMNLQAALQAPGTAALERRLEDSIKAVERVLEQVHDLSLNLRPSMLDDLGLEPALRWYTHRQAALTGMRAEFRADHLEQRLDPVIETECFRVGQEALTNVVRHAQARSVSVELARRNGHIHLCVRDDGVGFDVASLRGEAVRGASLGLLSMEERTALAGGGLEFKSAPGEGTEVHAWFPLKWQNTLTTAQLNE
jgi:signal transduction histidine kinase